MIKSAFLIVATCCSLQLFSQEKFPDGKIIPDWFYKNEKTDINGLGKNFLITDYGVVNDSTLLQTEKIQAVKEQRTTKISTFRYNNDSASIIRRQIYNSLNFLCL